jgi:hypothetical protein
MECAGIIVLWLRDGSEVSLGFHGTAAMEVGSREFRFVDNSDLLM